jgi:hypothetical protein
MGVNYPKNKFSLYFPSTNNFGLNNYFIFQRLKKENRLPPGRLCAAGAKYPITFHSNCKR